MATPLPLEPSWWGERDAVEERRALTEAFCVEDLEGATAALQGRCEQLEARRSCGEVVTVGEVADVLLAQWSVAFGARLADSQRAFCAWADHERLARAAEDGRAAAVAVRDRYLAPQRISGHSLQQALNLANADASGLRLDRSDALRVADRVTERTNRQAADDREAARARIVANEHARRAASARSLVHDDESVVRLDRVHGRGMSM